MPCWAVVALLRTSKKFSTEFPPQTKYLSGYESKLEPRTCLAAFPLALFLSLSF